REMIASIDLVARHEPLDFDRAGVLNPRLRRGNNLLLGCSLLCIRLTCAAPHRRWLFLSSRSLRSPVGPCARFLARLLELLILNDEKLTLADLVAPALLTGADDLTSDSVYELLPQAVSGCLVNLPEGNALGERKPA